MEPEPPVNLRPMVIVDGALCASSTAPAATLTLPTTFDHSVGTTAHSPVTVRLA